MSETDRPNYTIKYLLENRMFFLTLVTYVLLSLISGTFDLKPGYNQTVNYAVDLSFWITLFALICPIIALLSYLIIQIVKRKTSVILSSIHLGAIVLTAVVSFYFYNIQLIVLSLFIAQILAFILNLLFVFGLFKKRQV
ncbi:hypothetical protein [Spongiivirga citrea]|uniref:Uncharacterized protein n=1 Tax=Spongiivirga citrea TaxID=1481457 RepID=A0A6M0CMR3_9FLAO|nr:hypothetical protein [Spongiivirga citrea]NER17314.1 hypothetical protein [Spongiivirga citrea]